MKSLPRRLSLIFCISAVLLFFTSWSVAAVLDGAWTYGTNPLSDLGVSSNSTSVFLFNWCACIICSLLWDVQAIAIIYTEKGIGRVYGVLSLLSMVMLVLIGVFNESYGMVHNYMAAGYMGFATVSMIACCCTGFFLKRRILVYLTAVMLLVDLAMWLMMPFALFEANSIVLQVLWSLLVSYAFYTAE